MNENLFINLIKAINNVETNKAINKKDCVLQIMEKLINDEQRWINLKPFISIAIDGLVAIGNYEIEIFGKTSSLCCFK